jgi:sporulation protein YlmC with PRC-barrel domain
MTTPDRDNHDGVIGGDPSAGIGAHIIAADKLTSEKVVNEEGHYLGEIKHLMIDLHAGKVVYAVLSFGGFLGLGDKLFAVPWGSLAFDMDNKWFVLNVSKERLKSAPGFDKDHWPAMADAQWAAEVHGYYGPVAASRRPFI